MTPLPSVDWPGPCTSSGFLNSLIKQSSRPSSLPGAELGLSKPVEGRGLASSICPGWKGVLRAGAAMSPLRPLFCCFCHQSLASGRWRCASPSGCPSGFWGAVAIRRGGRWLPCGSPSTPCGRGFFRETACGSGAASLLPGVSFWGEEPSLSQDGSHARRGVGLPGQKQLGPPLPALRPLGGPFLCVGGQTLPRVTVQPDLGGQPRLHVDAGAVAGARSGGLPHTSSALGGVGWGRVRLSSSSPADPPPHCLFLTPQDRVSGLKGLCALRAGASL